MPKDAESCNIFKLYKLVASDLQSAELKAKYATGNYGYGQADEIAFRHLPKAN